MLRLFGAIDGVKTRLLFTDTDRSVDSFFFFFFFCYQLIFPFHSLCYEIVQKAGGGGTVDPWDVLSNNPMMEFSNCPTDHHLYSNEHHMQPGFFKSEFEDRTILEFVGLSAKVYSIMTLDGEVKKTHKGVTRSFQESCIQHEDYKQALFSTKKRMKIASTWHIASKNMKLFTVKRSKKYLSTYNDKYFFKSSFRKCGYGHYRLRKCSTGN